MEIKLITRMTGRQREEEVLQQYGSEKALEAAAASGDLDARAGLVDIHINRESPRNLDMLQTWEDTIIVEDGDLALLTPARWRVLEAVAPHGCTLVELGRVLARDKKNLSEDVRILERLGLVSTQRVGRTKRIWMRGEELRIVLPGARGDQAPAS